MIHIAICDDNEIFLENIKKSIANILDNKVSISTHTNAFSLLTYVMDEMKEQVDVILIDTRLKNQNGIQVAETLLAEIPNIKIIFMSNYIEMVKDIFRVNPVYFLTKPIEMLYLKDALYKVIRLVDEEKLDVIKIKHKNGHFKNIMTKDIYYIESDKRKLVFHLQDTEATCYMKLNDVEDVVKNNFIRVHQSYLVNLDKIKEYDKNGIILFNGVLVPISRSKYKEVNEAIKEYMNFI